MPLDILTLQPYFPFSKPPHLAHTQTHTYIPTSSLKFNPSHPDPGQRKKINLNFYFHTSLWCLKRFYEGL